MIRVSLCFFAIAVVLNTCNSEPREPEPVPDMQTTERLHLAEKCKHLYNVDRHREWADCVGVGYK